MPESKSNNTSPMPVVIYPAVCTQDGFVQLRTVIVQPNTQVTETVTTCVSSAANDTDPPAAA